jgi:hypothetical protein
MMELWHLFDEFELAWFCLFYFFLHGESIASTKSCEDRAIIHYVSPVKALVEDDHGLLQTN